jgi:hypothetical protein
MYALGIQMKIYYSSARPMMTDSRFFVLIANFFAKLNKPRRLNAYGVLL